MKKIILCALISISAGCALPRSVVKPDPSFTYNPSLRVRVACDTGSGSGAGKVQLTTFIESTSTEKIDVTINNFQLKDSAGKEFPAIAWRMDPMEDLNLRLKSYNLPPTTPREGEDKTFIDAHQAALFVLEFNRPSDPNYAFQFLDFAKKPLFSALCSPPQLDEKILKALKDAPLKKK